MADLIDEWRQVAGRAIGDIRAPFNHYKGWMTFNRATNDVYV
jgi:hypothetical protein